MTPEREADWIERLRFLFKDDGLERLTRANHDYYSTHGHYVPGLAKLLLVERAESASLRAAVGTLTKALRDEYENAHMRHHGEITPLPFNECPLDYCARRRARLESVAGGDDAAQ